MKYKGEKVYCCKECYNNMQVNMVFYNDLNEKNELYNIGNKEIENEDNKIKNKLHLTHFHKYIKDVDTMYIKNNAHYDCKCYNLFELSREEYNCENKFILQLYESLKSNKKIMFVMYSEADTEDRQKIDVESITSDDAIFKIKINSGIAKLIRYQIADGGVTYYLYNLPSIREELNFNDEITLEEFKKILNKRIVYNIEEKGIEDIKIDRLNFDNIKMHSKKENIDCSSPY